MAENFGQARDAIERAACKADALLTESGRPRDASGKVWVVDDNPEVADSLVLMLTVEGFPAVPVVGAASAVAKLRGGERPAVMLLDLAMPDGGGNAVLAEIDGHVDFPIVVLTAREDLLNPAHADKVWKVILKAGDPEALVSCLASIVGRTERKAP